MANFLLLLLFYLLFMRWNVQESNYAAIKRTRTEWKPCFAEREVNLGVSFYFLMRNNELFSNTLPHSPPQTFFKFLKF
jgi:hypothetical protein